MGDETRVVVTGIGIVSPLGLTTADTWDGIINGRGGVGQITTFDTSDQDTTFAAEVKDFDAGLFLDRKEVRRTDRFIQFAVAAAAEAVEMSGIAIEGELADHTGCIIGSGIGGLQTIQDQVAVMLEKGPRRMSPFTVPMMISDMASGIVSIQVGARGPNYATTSACSSGSDAIGTAFESIRRGDAVAMITGGTEAAITRIGIGAFAAARALSTRNDDPEHASRPFDAGRDGFVMGEGAAILVLENLEHAKARGARVLAEIIGYGASADAFHITQPPEGGEGAQRAMRMALKKAGVAPEEVDYINAHGTSTAANDKNETMAIKSVFGEHAYNIPVSSTKSMTGHLLGAAGAIEAAFCMLAIRDGMIPPTINYETPDPDCDLDYVPNQARAVPIKVALSNAFGFGGHNSCLIVRNYVE